jgi:DNA-binding NarL/FixJ family response regulator
VPRPNIKVLLLTTFEADNHVIQALKAGASGYILKDTKPGPIATAMQAVMRGDKVMASAVARIACPWGSCPDARGFQSQ